MLLRKRLHLAPNFRCVLGYPTQPAKLITRVRRRLRDTRDIIGSFPSHHLAGTVQGLPYISRVPLQGS